jgi:hypothetical protein
VNKLRVSKNDRWPVPQVAKILEVKQEVVYFLIRSGLLTSHPEVIGRRECAMVNREGLDAFRAQYVFARDLAKLQKTSPRSLQSRLADIGIHPVVSPTNGACRQVVYERAVALADLFSEFALQNGISR